MTSFLDVKTGLFDQSRRFAFTNITSEDFVSYWDKKPITVKQGQTVELPHYLAVKMTKEIVDKIMIGEAKLDEENFYKNNPNSIMNTYRSPKGGALGVPAARKVWEDSVLKEMEVDKESAEMQILRIKFREELVADASAQPSTEPVKVPVSTGEFTGLTSEFAELGK